MRVGRRRRSALGGVFRVHGVESAVFRISRVEGNGNKPGSVGWRWREFRKDFRKIDIRREHFAALVQDVQSAVLVDDEGTRRRRTGTTTGGCAPAPKTKSWPGPTDPGSQWWADQSAPADSTVADLRNP